MTDNMEPMQVLGQQYSVSILRATGTPKSVGHLSDTLDVPIATCYRRIDDLVAAGLLEECTDAPESSSGASVFRRTADAIGIRFDTAASIAWACVSYPSGIDTFSFEVSQVQKTRDQSRAVPERTPERPTATVEND